MHDNGSDSELEELQIQAKAEKELFNKITRRSSICLYRPPSERAHNPLGKILDEDNEQSVKSLNGDKNCSLSTVASLGGL